MRKNLPVTNKEVDYPSSLRIVSTTTAKGVIKYANQDFVEVAGYSTEELEGQAHNIVRHPDMPQPAFQSLWDAMKRNDPWMGLVKNRCKSGDHYWVDAFVMQSGETTNGEHDLQSVRFKPSREQIERAESAYQAINKGNAPYSTLNPYHWPVFYKTLAALVLTFVPVAVTLFLSSDSFGSGLGAIVISLILAGVLAQALTSGIRKNAEAAKKIYADPLAQYLYTGRADEIGAIELSRIFMRNKLETALWRVVDSTRLVEQGARSSVRMAEDTEANSQQQRSELDQLATAINEMSSSISEVSSNTGKVRELMETVEERVGEGSSQVSTTMQFVSELVDNLRTTEGKVRYISDSSQSISELVQSIRGIAEQTNLLALNAAIEAARAGDQGRGFAVVADEVRNLAGSTATTTEQIQSAIQEILSGVEEAVSLVQKTMDSSVATSEQSQQAKDSLTEITSLTKKTLDAMIQTASATEQQSAVCEEINRNVHHIQDCAVATCDNALGAQNEQQQQLYELQKLTKLAKDFTG